MPMSRKALSAVSVTCAIARFTGPGKAANRIPSMANTRPIATTKSDIPANHHPLLTRGSLPWGGRRCRRRRSPGIALRIVLALRARRIDEIAEELRIRRQHHAGVAVAHSRLVGLHRPIEREKVDILAEGFRED